MIRQVVDPVRLAWDTLRVCGSPAAAATWAGKPESEAAVMATSSTFSLPAGISPGWLSLKAFWKDGFSTTVH